MTPSILFLITARGGSKGLPGKNLKQIDGVSLIAFKAIAARKSKYCSRLIISSDDPAMQAEGRRHGAEAPFTRPDELASDTARSDDVILHAMNYCEVEEKRRYDAIMLLEPASPFAIAADFDAAVDMYMAKKAKLVVGLKRTEVHSAYVGPLGEDGSCRHIIDRLAKASAVRRQNFGPEYTLNGALYLIDWDHMRQTGRIYSNPDETYGHVMSRFYSMDIDTREDFRLAELLVDGGEVDIGHWK